MREKIGAYIHEVMKDYGVSNKKLERELAEACCDEYELRRSEGDPDEDAFRAAVANIEEIAKEKIVPRNKFSFMLGMGVLALCLSAAEMLGSLLTEWYAFYLVELPLAFAGIVVIAAVYLIVKRRSFRWYDLLVLGVMLLSWFFAFYAMLSVLSFNGAPGSWHDIGFTFPCVFRHIIHRDWWAAGAVETHNVFYPNFLTAAAIFLTALVLFIRQSIAAKRKKV